MNKKLCALVLGLTMAISVPFCTFANQPVDEVTCTAKQNENLEQTVLKGIGRDGSVVWTYETEMKERGENGQERLLQRHWNMMKILKNYGMSGVWRRCAI